MRSKKEEFSPVGKRLRAAQIAKGISQKQLGILAGIDEFSAGISLKVIGLDKDTVVLGIVTLLINI